MKYDVIIIGGGAVGCETADYLAPLVNDLFPRNREVTVLEMAPGVMLAESGPGRSLLVQRMRKKGVELICGAKVERIGESAIVYTKDGQEHTISDADTLVLAVGSSAAGLLPEPIDVFSPIFGGAVAQTEIIDKIGHPIGASDSDNGITISADAIMGDQYNAVIVYTISRDDGERILPADKALDSSRLLMGGFSGAPTAPVGLWTKTLRTTRSSW